MNKQTTDSNTSEKRSLAEKYPATASMMILGAFFIGHGISSNPLGLIPGAVCLLIGSLLIFRNIRKNSE